MKRRLLSHWTASVRYQLTTISSFESLPSNLLPTVLNLRWQIKPRTYGYEPSVTDASKPKNQIYQKCSATLRNPGVTLPKSIASHTPRPWTYMLSSVTNPGFVSVCLCSWIFSCTNSPNSGSTAVKALCYKSEGRWFDPSWCQWIFHRHKNLSDRTMALGSIQPLTEMSNSSISWGVKVAGA